MVEMRIQLLSVLVQVGEQAISAKDARNLHQLVLVVITVEEGLPSEDHAREHAPQAPDIQGVVVELVVHQKLGALVVARGDPHIVFFARMIELCQAPIDEPQLPVAVVDHHVLRLDVPVHDALRVAIVQCPEDLEDVKADVEVSESRIQRLELMVLDILEDQTRRLRRWVPDDVQQSDNVRTTAQVLEDPDLPLDLLCLHRLEDLDDTPVPCGDVHALEYLAVLATADLPDDLIVILRPPTDREVVVVPVLAWPFHIYVMVEARKLSGTATTPCPTPARRCGQCPRLQSAVSQWLRHLRHPQRRQHPLA
mmetsp:Transcript_87004/g.193546  ORF Transcript_87004/g.193546 Transcript_87004/m.193546 type:complete len:309 (+) Transcript_87004:276-1202(+)